MTLTSTSTISNPLPGILHDQTTDDDDESEYRELPPVINVNPLDQIALTAGLLGLVGGLALFSTYWAASTFPQLPLYVALLCLFHFLEYWITAKYNTSKVKLDSFLLNNGKTYIFAHGLALLETLITLAIRPQYKLSILHHPVWRLISLMGLIITLMGQTARSMAMIHASDNFSHVIQTRRAKSHRLVQEGIYHYTRHPSYFGFYYWALGTQILLCNPVSLVVFAGLLWKFFSERIEYEEEYLVQFFGTVYLKYRQTTPTLIPFVR